MIDCLGLEKVSDYSINWRGASQAVGTRDWWFEAGGEKSNVPISLLKKVVINLGTIEMVSSTLHASARSQPASYEHMEQALSVAISKPGENTQELTGGPSDSMEEAPAGVGKNPHKNGAMPASKSPQHESDTQKVANPLLSNTDVAAQSQEGESSDPNEVPANACFSAPGAPQTGSYGNDIATSNPPASDGSEKKTELRPLAPSPVALGPGFESAPPTISLDHLSSFQEVSKVR